LLPGEEVERFGEERPGQVLRAQMLLALVLQATLPGLRW